MILVIDNYDSFTYNLVQYAGVVTSEIEVVRNDAVDVPAIRDLAPERIIISPGPGRPEDAGISVQLVRDLGPVTPILGICLGHQAIAAAYGGRIIPAPEIRHGKLSAITHEQGPLYEGVPSPFQATRYHSLVADTESLPTELHISARTGEGTIMGLRHTKYPVEGMQFHPESILTEYGPQMIENFILRFP